MTREEVAELVSEAWRSKWEKRWAEPARQPHRQKAEAVFGADVVVRLCGLAQSAEKAHIRGDASAEADLLKKNIAGILEHLKKALALADEARKRVGFGDRRSWSCLEGVLESAKVDAGAMRADIARTFLLVPQTKRNRGAPSVRSEFVRLVRGRVTGLEAKGASAWMHLGIAVGIDEPPPKNARRAAKLKQMTDDYGRILRNPNR